MRAHLSHILLLSFCVADTEADEEASSSACRGSVGVYSERVEIEEEKVTRLVAYAGRESHERGGGSANFLKPKFASSSL